jgi:hypothetical protein
MTQDYSFGKDCPVGQVQIEFIGVSPSLKQGEYGYKPSPSAFLEIYIDGEPLRIQVGDFHDGKEQRRGLHIIGPLNIKAEQTALNACSIIMPKR